MELVQVSLNWTFFVQMVNFLILMYILNALLLKPVLGTMRKRDQIIETDIKEAEGKGEEASELFRRHERIIENTHLEIMDRLGKTRKEAEKLQSEMLQHAREEALARIERARGEIRSESASAMESLRSEAGRLSAAIAEKILGRTVAER